jgi:hypothetical protein
MSSPSHPPYLLTLIISYEGYKLWKSSLCNFLHPSVPSSPLTPNILFSTSCTETQYYQVAKYWNQNKMAHAYVWCDLTFKKREIYVTSSKSHETAYIWMLLSTSRFLISVPTAEHISTVEPRNQTNFVSHKTSRERPFSTVVNTRAKHQRKRKRERQKRILGLQLCRDVSGRGSVT